MARRPFTVAEALAHVRAPRHQREWAEQFGSDFERAWSECPRASWLAHLAVAVRMPFASMLAAVAAAHALRRADVESPALERLRVIASSDLFKGEERNNNGYNDGFFEQAYQLAANELDAIELDVVGKAGRTPDDAIRSVLDAVRAHTSVDVFMRAYRRELKAGYCGLQIER